MFSMNVPLFLCSCLCGEDNFKVIFASLRRYDDPNSAQSSFSMLLGDAPHLDRQVS